VFQAQCARLRLTKVLQFFISQPQPFNALLEVRDLADVIFQSSLSCFLLHLKLIAVFTTQFLEFTNLIRARLLYLLSPFKIFDLGSMI